MFCSLEVIGEMSGGMNCCRKCLGPYVDDSEVQRLRSTDGM